MKLKKLILIQTVVLLALWTPLLLILAFRNNPLVPAWKWRAKAVDAEGKTVPVWVCRMYGHDMPLMLRIGVDHELNTIWPWMLYSDKYKGSFWGISQGWYMVNISEEKIWGRQITPPSLWWFPWPNLAFKPDNYYNEMNHAGNGKSVVFSNMFFSVSVSKKESP